MKTARHSPLWHIRIQRRCEYNGLYPRDDWRAYRERLVWPRVFASATAAQAYLDQCFTFKGLTGHKMSASVCQCALGPSAQKGQW